MFNGDPTWVNAHGSVHSGSGTQYNTSHYYAAPSRRTHDPLKVATEDRRRLDTLFIPPVNFAAAAERIAAPGATVLLDAADGTGRRAAAWVMLHRIAGRAGIFGELSLEGGENGEDRAKVVEGDRYLLDLSRCGQDEYRGAERTVRRFRAEFADAGSHLVVILPPGLGRALDPELRYLRVELGRPSGLGVLRAHLNARGVLVDAMCLANERHLAAHIAQAPMRELARLAEQISRAEPAQRASDLEQVCARAVGEVGDHSKEAAELLRAHRDTRARALLLASAVYCGSSTDVVLDATERLLDRLESAETEDHPLARPDLLEQILAFAAVKVREGAVVFEHFDQDHSVRRHFWRYFPDLRDAFCAWVTDRDSLIDLSPAERSAVVRRFAELSLTVGRPGDLTEAVERWTRSEAGGLNDGALEVLEYGLRDERHGGHIRSRLYRWARESHSTHLGDVVVAVCEGELIATRPDEALVRLHNLAVRQGAPGAEAARSALLRLAVRNPSWFRKVVDRLCFELRRSEEQNLALLAALLAPEHSRAEIGRDAFHRGWRRLLSQHDPSVWQTSVHRWLDEVTAGSPQALPVLDALVSAAHRTRRLDEVYKAGIDWLNGRAAPSPPTAEQAPRPAAERVAALLWRKIDRALGLDTTPRPGTPTPQETR